MKTKLGIFIFIVLIVITWGLRRDGYIWYHEYKLQQNVEAVKQLYASGTEDEHNAWEGLIVHRDALVQTGHLLNLRFYFPQTHYAAALQNFMKESLRIDHFHVQGDSSTGVIQIWCSSGEVENWETTYAHTLDGLRKADQKKMPGANLAGKWEGNDNQFAIMDDIRRELQDKSHLTDENTPEEELRRKELVNRVYTWCQHAFSELSGKEFVELCKRNLQLMPEDVSRIWTNRLNYQAAHSGTPIVGDILFWEQDKQELIVFRFDYVSLSARDGGYLVSTPPRLMVKQNDTVVYMDMAEWEYSKLGSLTYTIHGLVESDAGDVPDVLLSTGPVGSGNYVYLAQFHFDQPKQKWQVVWQAAFGHVTDVAYHEDNSELTIKYLADKMSEEIESSHIHLKWGGQARN